MNILYLKPEEQIAHEIAQSRQEGKPVTEVEREWDLLISEGLSTYELRRAAERLLIQLGELQPNASLLSAEPSDLDTIRARSKANELSSRSGSLSEESLLEKIHGGWLGRAAGCLLGKPVEKIGRTGIREILTVNDHWPLSDYFTARGVPDELLNMYPWNRHGGPESLKENITCMPEDDDMNYPIVNLVVAEKYGPAFETEDVAEVWLRTLPVMTTFTAERVAYVNSLKMIPISNCATTNNPYREWIGAQIRADMWGWLSCGNPFLASQYAWRDARFSHTRNGIYGEMFFAAAIAEAAVSDDLGHILTTALNVVPGESRFAKAILSAMAIAHDISEWESVVDQLYKEHADLFWVHTINNAALVTAALVHGNGDFERTICSAVMGGWDADCNGATAGSILGTMIGKEGLPAKWINPLKNCLRSSVTGFDNSAFDHLAGRTCALHPTFSATNKKEMPQ
jgi:ADP-ribosylglycohydrolase